MKHGGSSVSVTLFVENSIIHHGSCIGQIFFASTCTFQSRKLFFFFNSCSCFFFFLAVWKGRGVLHQKFPWNKKWGLLSAQRTLVHLHAVSRHASESWAIYFLLSTRRHQCQEQMSTCKKTVVKALLELVRFTRSRCFCSMQKLDVDYRILPCHRAVPPLSRFDAEAHGWIYLIDQCTGCTNPSSEAEPARAAPRGVWDRTRLHCGPSSLLSELLVPSSWRGLRTTAFTAADGFDFMFFSTNSNQSANTNSLFLSGKNPSSLNQNATISISQHFCQCTRFRKHFNHQSLSSN